MKAHLALLALALTPVTIFAQTVVNKSIPASAGQTVTMKFDYPELIKVTTWDKNEVQVTGTVSINGGENDDAFDLQTSTSGNQISIRGDIRNMKNLPHRITVDDGAKKLTFKNKEEFQKFEKQNGKKVYNNQSWGVDIDIVLEIKVPRNMITKVEATYGMVEVKNFNAPLTVDATYGGVDAAVNEKSMGEITAETNYGDIFTNLDSKFGGESSKNEDFHTVVSVKPGSGPAYKLDSKYGNVYIRKAVN